VGTGLHKASPVSGTAPERSALFGFGKASISNPNPNRPSTGLFFGQHISMHSPPRHRCSASNPVSPFCDIVSRLRRRHVYLSPWPQRLRVLLSADMAMPIPPGYSNSATGPHSDQLLRAGSLIDAASGQRPDAAARREPYSDLGRYKIEPIIAFRSDEPRSSECRRPKA
jgi:hypothetical protein